MEPEILQAIIEVVVILGGVLTASRYNGTKVIEEVLDQAGDAIADRVQPRIEAVLNRRMDAFDEWRAEVDARLDQLEAERHDPFD